MLTSYPSAARRLLCALLPLLAACPEIERCGPGDEGRFTCDGTTLERCADGLIEKKDCSASSCDAELGACSSCGDGAVSPGEACDDNDNTPGDGCDALCVIEPGFDCDNSSGSSAC